MTEARRCEQLAQGGYAASSGWELNQPLIDYMFNALLLHFATPECDTRDCRSWAKLVRGSAIQIHVFFTSIYVCFCCIINK